MMAVEQWGGITVYALGLEERREGRGGSLGRLVCRCATPLVHSQQVTSRGAAALGDARPAGAQMQGAQWPRQRVPGAHFMAARRGKTGSGGALMSARMRGKVGAGQRWQDSDGTASNRVPIRRSHRPARQKASRLLHS